MTKPPKPVAVIWTDSTGRHWMIDVYWRVQHGAPAPVGLTISAWDTEGQREEGDIYPSESNPTATPRVVLKVPHSTQDVEFPSVNAALVRELPVGQILNATLENWRAQLNPPPLPADAPESWHLGMDQWRAMTEEERTAVDGGPRSGRDLGDDHYRRVADTYALAVTEGRPPTMAVAEALTLSKSAAAKQVARARERGFLPKTTRGRVGRLTEEL